MYKPESDLENETHKILWGFGIQTDHLILTRRPDLVLRNKDKRIWYLVNLAVPVDHSMKIKGIKNIEKYRDLAGELKIYGTYRRR